MGKSTQRLKWRDKVIKDKTNSNPSQASVDQSETLQIVELPVVEVKYKNEIIDSPEDTKTDFDINILVNNEFGSIDSVQFFWNDSVCTVAEEKNVDDKLNLLLSKQPEQKVKTKSKAVAKYRKKYTKAKTERHNKVIKEKTKSNRIHTIKKNDEFIANSEFHLSCCICSVSLGNFNILKIHFRKEHDILGYVMCCSKKFYKRGVLVDHINVHKDPKYFKCLQCNKAFSARRSYDRHTKTHQLYKTRQNLFTCEICDKSFLKKPVFDRHILTHVPVEERSFQCSMCDKKFASRYRRKQHCTIPHI